MLKNNILTTAAFLAMATVAVNCATFTHAQDPPSIGIETKKVAKPMSADEKAAILKKASKVLAFVAIGRMQSEIQQTGLKLDIAGVIEGAKLAAQGGELGIEQDEIRKVMTGIQQLAAEEMAMKSEKNKAAGEAFLAENAKREGVQKLENGVQYTVLKEGTGAKPTAQDSVKLHYHGTKIDGEVFDSSVDRGKPITGPASGFVPGFSAAVQSMPVGSKWKVVIPSDLAYGARGPLGPNQTLIFEIELLEIVGSNSTAK